MEKKKMLWKTRGMNQDLSVSAFNPEFSFENRNIRLSTNEGNTQLSWVNEKGTKAVDLVEVADGLPSITLVGVPVGTAVLNQKLILFTIEASATPKNNTTRIYMLYDCTEAGHEGYLYVKKLYEGLLQMDTSHPIETLASYESELVQKVYWVDGVNQPRVINVVGTIRATPANGAIDSQFDFVPELQLKETVKVKKIVGGGGTFAPGVIQYAFTYFNQHLQETNIFYTTPLYYISYIDRGASPEDKVNNSFEIKVSGIDTNFDYLRIYSIQRTSLNGTPIVKRVQDISIKFNTGTVTYVDNGTTGDSIDPTELLFKGGETISAETITQKDNTLFLGNIKVTRENLKSEADNIKSLFNGNHITCGYRSILSEYNIFDTYEYANQLTAFPYNNGVADKTQNIPCCGFKRGNTYRLGVQFQYKNGKWSDPIYIGDKLESNKPEEVDSNIFKLPVFKASVAKSDLSSYYNAGYRRIRPIVAMPEPKDRQVLCQGVTNCTLYTNRHSYSQYDNDLQGQSSWFFRTFLGSSPAINSKKGSVAPTMGYTNDLYNIPYTSNAVTYNPATIKSVEIQGEYDIHDQFKTNTDLLTFHSPDIEFDDYIATSDLVALTYQQVGDAVAQATMSDINIQTSSPTISNNGSGFVHKSFVDSGMHGIVSGLFYDDCLVDDIKETENIEKHPLETVSYKWMVYAWNKTGSLNNDITRPAGKGTPSAVLKKKVISNLRYFTTNYSQYADTTQYKHTFDDGVPQVFNSEELTIVKVGNRIYMGNIDTLLMPSVSDGMYMASTENTAGSSITTFTSEINSKTFSSDFEHFEDGGVWWWSTEYDKFMWPTASKGVVRVGDVYLDLILKKEAVRMKYKSTPHIVGYFTRYKYSDSGPIINLNWDTNTLPVVDLVRGIIPYGDSNDDTLEAHNWIPCGEPVDIHPDEATVNFEYSYGDTYFQRYDCLKTYPYTPEDENQIVEIGSFMLETYVNIDGRYDRNRGQKNNLNMTPRNFNLINPVYSQQDNFFSYKILPAAMYRNNVYPNQITWSKTKQSNAEVDLWTNITLASFLELDGNKGVLNKLLRFNDQLLAFQDSGISQILYNENTQISTTAGVPIEIANSGKVQGKRYLTNTVGCSNKWSIAATPSGIYFIDSHNQDIFQFNGQLTNLSTTLGFNTWAKNHISVLPNDKRWTPEGFEDFRTVYDSKNQEVLFISKDIALAYSEKFNVFSSFYNYGSTPWLEFVGGRALWVDVDSKIWEHQKGDYCSFFGTNYPYWITLVGNPEPQLDKIFTNIEFRACVSGEGEATEDSFTPYLPFDSLEVWDEYQHGKATLSHKNGKDAMKHFMSDGSAALKRKFRIWACDIPRDNVAIPAQGTAAYNAFIKDETAKGISRFKSRPLDRMRNSWLYLKLMKECDNSSKVVLSLVEEGNEQYYLLSSKNSFLADCISLKVTCPYPNTATVDVSDSGNTPNPIEDVDFPYTFSSEEIATMKEWQEDVLVFKLKSGTPGRAIVLERETSSTTSNTPKVEVHDMVMDYYR